MCAVMAYFAFERRVSYDDCLHVGIGLPREACEVGVRADDDCDVVLCWHESVMQKKREKKVLALKIEVRSMVA